MDLNQSAENKFTEPTVKVEKTEKSLSSLLTSLPGTVDFESIFNGLKEEDKQEDGFPKFTSKSNSPVAGSSEGTVKSILKRLHESSESSEDEIEEPKNKNICLDFKVKKEEDLDASDWSSTEEIDEDNGPKIIYKRNHCTICWQSFSNKIQLKRHVNKAHNLIPPKYSCVPCKKVFHLAKKFTEHFRKCEFGYMQPKIFACEKCENKYVSESHRQQHFRAAHGEKPLFPCSLCGKEFKKLKTLNFHISTHPELWQSCGVCKRPFRRTIDLKKHLLTHDNKVPYFCHSCKIGFIEKREFKRHKKKFHKKASKAKKDKNSFQQASAYNYNRRYYNNNAS